MIHLQNHIRELQLTEAYTLQLWMLDAPSDTMLQRETPPPSRWSLILLTNLCKRLLVSLSPAVLLRKPSSKLRLSVVSSVHGLTEPEIGVPRGVVAIANALEANRRCTILT